MSTIDEMWAAFEAHKPAPGYADAWATMLKKRTKYSIWSAHCAAPRKSAAASATAAAAAAWAAYTAEEAWAEAAADDYAQQAIDAIKEVKP